MIINNPQKGAVVLITLTMKDQDGAVIDISTASAKKIVFEKPDNTTVEQTADFVTTGTDGKIKFQTSSTDLTQAGLWQLQGKVTVAGVVLL